MPGEAFRARVHTWVQIVFFSLSLVDWQGSGLQPGSSYVPGCFCSVIMPGVPARPGWTCSTSKMLAFAFISSDWEWFLQHTHCLGLNNLPPKCCPWPPVLFIFSFLLSFISALFSSIQFNHSVMSNSATPRTVSQSLLKPMSTESVMPSNHLIVCHPLLLPPSIFPSIRVFPNESVLHIRWPKYWSFSFSISPSNEHSGLISFRIDWLHLLAVQGTLKSLLQHHSSLHLFLPFSTVWLCSTIVIV